jgi:RND family efflux transporter MFP subunit
LRLNIIQPSGDTAFMRAQSSFYRTSLLLIVATLAASLGGCGGGGNAAPQQAGGGRGGPPATGVTIVTLEQKPIEKISDFIATVRSLHSTTIQPLAEGQITRIYVKSGDRVREGTPLAQIDPAKQTATVRQSESTRAARVADVDYWKAQVARLKALLDAGAVSRNELDQAQHSYDSAVANLAALDAQVREGQVELQYYRVTAPTAGIVGDIPVREGDRVTTSTLITTIDDQSGLEAYLQVPLDRAPELRLGLPVQILDPDGKVLATNRITFVAPRVDDATQTVLAKALLKDVPPSTRVQQFVRARVIWRSEPGLTVPIVSVLRIGGQYFVFVAETTEQGLVAKQRPVQIGETIGNDYVVTGGLKPGDRIIVSGVQKIGDGMPVKAQ